MQARPCHTSDKLCCVKAMHGWSVFNVMRGPVPFASAKCTVLLRIQGENARCLPFASHSEADKLREQQEQDEATMAVMGMENGEPGGGNLLHRVDERINVVFIINSAGAGLLHMPALGRSANIHAQ